MELNTRQIRYLRGLAHPLNPMVQTGKGGYSPQIVSEVARNLAAHELIKVKIQAEDRASFYELSAQLAQETDAALVQTIGRIVVLYRPSEEPAIRLP